MISRREFLGAAGAAGCCFAGPCQHLLKRTIQDKPGLGVELNPDVVKAHLAPGETWWG